MTLWNEAAVERAARAIGETEPDWSYGNKWAMNVPNRRRLKSVALLALNAALSPEWRDIKAELPPFYVKVLGWWSNGECHVGQLCEDGRWVRDMDKSKWLLPDFWRHTPSDPLPAPPKETG